MPSKDLALKTAKDPVANPEIIMVPADTEQVSCNGGHPTLGHPKVYYRFEGADFIECMYCDRRFVRQKR